MNKKALRLHPVFNATEETVIFSKSNSVSCIIQAEKIQDSEIIVLNLFICKEVNTGELTPVYRIFCKKNDYLTQYMRGNKTRWLSGSIEKLFERDFLYTDYTYRVNSWRWWTRALIVDKESVCILSSFLSTDNNILKGLHEWQLKIIGRRLQEKKEKIKAEMDLIMQDIPDLPSDFEDWINTTCTYKNNILYYRYSKKEVKDGYCTVCKSSVEVKNTKHNTKGVCPNCGERVTFKSAKKQKRNYVRQYAYIIQKSNSGNGIWLRGFDVDNTFYPMEKPKRYRYEETIRWHFQSNSKVVIYEYGFYGNVYRWGVHQTRDKHVITEGALYEANINEVLNGSIYQYSALFEFATHQKGYQFFPHRYIWNYPEHKYTEYLVKLKLFGLAYDVLINGSDSSLNPNGKSVYEVLKCDQNLLPLILELNVNKDELSFLRIAYKEGIRFNAELFLKYRYAFGLNEELFDCLKYTTISKLTKYLTEQAKILHIHSFELARDYRDYFEWCIELKYDLNNNMVLYPRSFKQAHDETFKSYEQHKDKIKKKKLERMERKYIKSIYPRLVELFQKSSNELTVVIPKCKKDLVQEGQEQHHCVGSYAEKVLKGMTIIVFIRKKDELEKSLYTCEISNAFKLIQLRGKNNKKAPDNIQHFVEKIIEEAKNNAENAENIQYQADCA